jgi:hypothetical protein
LLVSQQKAVDMREAMEARRVEILKQLPHGDNSGERGQELRDEC